ncbi:hypothetical protein ATANTOWER_008117 [Ataeniobius toweri]|uniref:Uncharacterized protein n=1 Tax=Ataeniobius toweri TaxID=208326 RepID=A0ABU7A1I6_9TELE|nr:hypothetical protein [Ataeniobius toweri]
MSCNMTCNTVSCNQIILTLDKAMLVASLNCFLSCSVKSLLALASASNPFLYFKRADPQHLPVHHEIFQVCILSTDVLMMAALQQCRQGFHLCKNEFSVVADFMCFSRAPVWR